MPTGVKVIDLDGADTSAATVKQLRARGIQPICYLNAGGWENWRADARAFPKSAIGHPLDDWPGERWLDIRKRTVLLPIMAARMNTCKAKGFRAVDPDNLDGYAANSGFRLTRNDAIAYQKALTQLAHARGLAIGLKNAVEILPALAATVDFAVNEECLSYRECGAYAILTKARKAVFHIEYTGRFTTICARRPAGFSTVLAPTDLDAATRAC